MSLQKSEPLSRLWNLRQLLISPKKFFAELAGDCSVWEGLYFLLFISSCISSAQVLQDRTLNAQLMTGNFFKFEGALFVLLLLVSAWYAASAALVGSLLAARTKTSEDDSLTASSGLHTEKFLPKMRLTFTACAFTLAPFLLLALSSRTATVCAILLTCILGSIALSKLYGLSMIKAAMVQLLSFGGIWMTLFIVAFAVLNSHHSNGNYPAYAMVDKPAPEAVFKRLDGGKQISLKEMTKDSVVVLDFWATWCPPCRAGLPVLSNVVSKFKGRGVRLYAVSDEVDPVADKKYLDDKHIDAAPVMCDQAVNTVFGVVAIPETLVIDKNNVVRAVHVGGTFDEEAQVTGEIEKALSASSPARSAIPPDSPPAPKPPTVPVTNPKAPTTPTAPTAAPNPTAPSEKPH